MSDWTEEDSQTYRDIASVAVPRRGEILSTLLSLIPFERDDRFRLVDLACGEGLLSEAALDRFPNATLLALDGSPTMLEATRKRTTRFGGRVEVRRFELETLTWWDLMAGAGVVLSSLAIHHLNDAKKQYLYKAIAERLSPGGALLIADLVERAHPVSRRVTAEAWDRHAQEQALSAGRPDQFDRFRDERWNHFRYPDAMDRPAPILHHLIWLRHAGLADVDCFWMFAGHAVFGGFKPVPQTPAAG